MSRVRQTVLCLAVILAAALAQAQPAPTVSAQTRAIPPNLMPPTVKLQSPIDFFRRLLLMPPQERMTALTNRTPQSRALILAKVHEYLALNPDERELRLEATELRWYLTPLLQMPPTNRAARLAQIPPEMQKLVISRLTEWDLLPPPLQEQILAYQKTLNYVAHIQTQPPPPPDPQQERLADGFNRFFELTPGEKQKVLGTLSEAERAQMEKTLKTFGQLPPEQRDLCIHNYAKFAGLTDAERAEFLKNAESWSKMSPRERQTWRDLVANIPLWPPMPSARSQQISKTSP